MYDPDAQKVGVLTSVASWKIHRSCRRQHRRQRQNHLHGEHSLLLQGIVSWEITSGGFLRHSDLEQQGTHAHTIDLYRRRHVRLSLGTNGFGLTGSYYCRYSPSANGLMRIQSFGVVLFQRNLSGLLSAETIHDLRAGTKRSSSPGTDNTIWARMTALGPWQNGLRMETARPCATDTSHA